MRFAFLFGFALIYDMSSVKRLVESFNWFPGLCGSFVTGQSVNCGFGFSLQHLNEKVS